jgi:hypothetical protein
MVAGLQKVENELTLMGDATAKLGLEQGAGKVLGGLQEGLSFITQALKDIQNSPEGRELVRVFEDLGTALGEAAREAGLFIANFVKDKENLRDIADIFRGLVDPVEVFHGQDERSLLALPYKQIPDRLEDPLTAQVTREVEALGFFFAGVMPRSSIGDDLMPEPRARGQAR